jgi:putative ABC transport system permease protein
VAKGTVFQASAVLIETSVAPFAGEAKVGAAGGAGVITTVTGAVPVFHLPRTRRSFQSLGLYRWDSRSVTGLAEPEEVRYLHVTAEVLPMLGVRPALGRWFSEKEDAPGSPRTTVLMRGWWQARFGGDRSVIGRQIVVDGVSHQVIGVMPADFRFLDREAALVLPLQFDRNKAILGEFDYPGIARLKPGVTIEQAGADIARMIPIALHSFPPSPGLTVKTFEDVRLAPKLRYLKQNLVGDVGKTLWVLMGTLGAVLLVACARQSAPRPHPLESLRAD